MPARRDIRIAERLITWFHASARDLPWRTADRDPYRSLISEAMLQQTQVARVLEKFDDFLARFPTVRALAKAPEQDVLAAWSGLGYYRRARNLQRAARAIVADHGARVPSDFDALRALPGIGTYTAGAIASIVFQQPTPAVDANARRVILRIEGLSADTSARTLDARATDLVRAATEPGAFNEALMELGALVCAPAAPKCHVCPMSRLCRARAAGLQEEFRPKKARVHRVPLYLSSVLVQDAQGRVRAHARPNDGPGLWSGMFQPPTIERPDRHATPSEVKGFFSLRDLVQIDSFDHATTHRMVHFEIWRARASQKAAARLPGEFFEPSRLADLPLSNPHRRILLA